MLWILSGWMREVVVLVGCYLWAVGTWEYVMQNFVCVGASWAWWFNEWSCGCLTHVINWRKMASRQPLHSTCQACFCVRGSMAFWGEWIHEKYFIFCFIFITTFSLPILFIFVFGISPDCVTEEYSKQEFGSSYTSITDLFAY